MPRITFGAAMLSADLSNRSAMVRNPQRFIGPAARLRLGVEEDYAMTDHLTKAYDEELQQLRSTLVTSRCRTAS